MVPAHVDETPRPDESADHLVRRLARTKALAVAGERRRADVVLAGDTVVEQAGVVLGKPTDPADAAAMLARLSGREHRAVSGVAVCPGATSDPDDVRTEVVATVVGFRDLTPADVDGYLATGEWTGKAGAYGIQGAAGMFVTHLQGLDTTVVGLPLGPAVALLAAAGVDTWAR